MTLCSGVPGTGPVAAGVTSSVLRQKKDHLLQPVGSTSNTASQYDSCRLLGQGHITGSRSVSMLSLSICLKSLTLNCRWMYKAINKLILTQCPRRINIRIVTKWPLEDKILNRDKICKVVCRKCCFLLLLRFFNQSKCVRKVLSYCCAYLLIFKLFNLTWW